jgi:hypothetical protein
LFPTIALFPVSSQTLDIILNFYIVILNKGAKKGIFTLLCNYF